MIELLFRFTVKETVLRNYVCILFQHVVAVRCTVQRCIAKFAKPEKRCTLQSPLFEKL
jgi:hypothetical protein